jgi:uncharacterized membrane protein YtjA (UPF0391 family)
MSAVAPANHPIWNKQLIADVDRLAASAPSQRGLLMGNLLYWAVVFLIVALVAAFVGFGGVAGVATEGARLLFWVAIILVILSFIGGMLRRG